jgi:hypothetical protein
MMVRTPPTKVARHTHQREMRQNNTIDGQTLRKKDPNRSSLSRESRRGTKATQATGSRWTEGHVGKEMPRRSPLSSGRKNRTKVLGTDASSVLFMMQSIVSLTGKDCWLEFLDVHGA